MTTTADVSVRNPYSDFLDKLEKPARYIGGEKFLQLKNWDEVDAKVALCFPDAYEIGMSHLGFKILYQELNKNPKIVAERSFAPWPDMEKEIREKDLPLVSLDTFRPLKDFDILGFSLQYELTYTNILNMLELGGVPIWQKDRTEDGPFVICGGPCATHPEPLAPFMDFIVIGDGEDLFERLSLEIGQRRKKGWSRQDILKSLSRWEGIYVPSLYKTEVCDKTEFEVLADNVKIKRFMVADLTKYEIPTESPIPHMTAIFDRYSVELARGCTEGCRFCQAGMIYRPVRERRPDDVIKSVIEGVTKGGFEEASLTCLSTADYSAITPLLIELLDKMKEKGASLGISSLRAYGLDPRILDKMAEVKNSSLTFAPEAGTERMRKVINKNITEEDLLKTAENIVKRGWRKMKLYFMIGLPTEQDEDVQGIMETAKKAKDVANRLGVRSFAITVSASSFVPKPHTPFQWSSMITLSEIERKQEMLWRLSKQYKINFRKHLSKSSYLEGIIARGDRPIANLIYKAFKKGARFDGWNEHFDFELWTSTIEELGIDPAKYLGTIRMDGTLPWDHIDVGLEDKFLEREYKKALKNYASPPCGKPMGAIVHHSDLAALEQTHDIEKKRLVCYHCGLKCDLTGMVDERRDFLKSLDAVKSERYQMPVYENHNVKHLREKRNQVVGYRYRIRYQKLGSICFISHLDTQKIISRIFKRADVTLLQSEGFHTRPLIAFGPALALGVSSLSEYIDVRVPAPWVEPNKVLVKLNLNSEKGIFFEDVQEVSKQSPSIQAAMEEFEYFFPINEKIDEEKLEAMKKQETWEIAVYRAKKRKYIKHDLKTRIKDISIQKWQAPSDREKLLYEILGNFSDGVMAKVKVEEGAAVKPFDLSNYLKTQGIHVGRPIKINSVLGTSTL